MKFRLVLLLVLGGVLLAVGVCSLALLQTDRLPVVTLPSLLDNTASVSLEDAYGDQFPLRERLMGLNRAMNRFYYFSVGDDNLLAIDYQGGAEFGGERLQELPEPVTAQPVLPEIDLPDESNVTAVGTIIISGNRAMDIPTATNDLIVEYGKTVSRIAAAMPKGVRTFSLVTPNGGQFYSPVSFHTGKHDQKAMIDLCYASMTDAVATIDAYARLAERADEYLFFRTDHHWTQKGAYYAYGAFCDAAGFTAPELDSYETGSYEGFVGSMYNYTSAYPQSAALLNEPDVLTYYLPQTETAATYYADTTLTDGVPIPVIDIALRDAVSNKYLCFLGGDTPICVIETAAEGGVCMVIKESFGNALVPFLTQHYSRIVTIDAREFNEAGKPQLDLAAFAREQGVDDLLIVDYPFMISSQTYIGKLSGLLG